MRIFRDDGRGWIFVAIVASCVFLVNIFSPPGLMDDVDSVQAQIARNMLTSGDWVTARLDGVAYLEKAPLPYWLMAVSFQLFGIHDWAARIPLAFGSVLLCCATYAFARWAFCETAGIYAGTALATCVGLFLFTRILIPDALLTLCITLALWSSLRLLEDDVRSRVVWAAILGGAFGAGLLTKGLIAVLFPLLALLAYLAVTRKLLSLAAWAKLRLGTGSLVAVLIALPWHLMAILRNPPYFVFSFRSGPGLYRGFFWFYFFNEHILRFLNLRYPRDYNTVPRVLFWALNLLWLFPWSAYLVGAARLSYRPDTRQGRVQLMCLCWMGSILLFFTFSTTQEYYSMPIYPAAGILIGSIISTDERAVLVGNRIVRMTMISVCALLAVVLALVWRLPAPGTISDALVEHTELYTLSLGHAFDLTIPAFAYLKLPLALSIISLALTSATLTASRKRPARFFWPVVLCMIAMFEAARLALVTFDPYLSSRQLAASLMRSPPGQLIEADAYYAFSSVFFYGNRNALLWNGRSNNLEYGSYAPDAPQVFISDTQLMNLWTAPGRCYLVAYATDLPRVRGLLATATTITVDGGSGKVLLTNHPFQ